MTCRKTPMILRTLVALALTVFTAVAAAEPLRVALSPDYMPLAFKQDGKLRGPPAVDVRGIDRRSVVEEEPDHLRVAVARGEVQRLVACLGQGHARAAPQDRP